MNKLTQKFKWEEVVDMVANQIESRNPNFKRKEFVEWYKTKEYVGKPFDPTLIYMAWKSYKRLIDDKDNVTVICGLEGDGKTTLGINLCSLISPNFNFNNTCFTNEELIRNMQSMGKTESILADEGGVMLFSREAMNTTNKMAIKLLMAVRNKNINFVICVPNFFNIDSYIREHRVNMLIQIRKRSHYRGFLREGVGIINRCTKNKNVLATKIGYGKFWDGTFNKEISKGYDYKMYLEKKDYYINRYLDSALKDSSDSLEGLIPIFLVSKKLHVSKLTIKGMIKRKEIMAKKIGKYWYISVKDYNKLVKMGGV